MATVQVSAITTGEKKSHLFSLSCMFRAIFPNEIAFRSLAVKKPEVSKNECLECN